MTKLKSAIFKWKGSPKKDFIYLTKPSEKFCLAQKLNLKPTIDHLESNSEELLETFKATIVVGFENVDKEKIYLDIDFPLFQLLRKVQEGYRPNKKDEEDAINFLEFLERLNEFRRKEKGNVSLFS